MKYFKPLRLHFYGLRKTYALFFLFLLLLAATLRILSIKDTLIQYLMLLFSLLSSLFVGAYEFKVISNSYLSLKINRKNFYVSSILFGILHSLLLTSFLCLIMFLLGVYDKNIEMAILPANLYTYLYAGVYFFVFYLLGNFASLYLKRMQLLKTLVGITLFIGLILYGTKSFQIGYDAFLKFLSDPLDVFYILQACIPAIPLLAVVNYIKFCIKY